MRNLLWLFLVVAFTRASAAEPPTWRGDPVKAGAELERQWQTLDQPAAEVGIRGTLRFAVEAAGIGWHPERVAAALARARSLQDRDRASPTFGNFRWRSGQSTVLDLNGVEFAVQLLGFLHAAHHAALNDEARQRLKELLTDGVQGLRSHTVRVDYTNIFVMKAWGLIAAGEALGRPEVAADGYDRFEAWLRHTAKRGIGEYGAVTYYGIDLDSLALIARYAGRPAARAQALTAIRYLWTDIAAHWWAPGDRLAGANARSYDYLFGTGYLEAHTWTAGWLQQRPKLEGAGWHGGVQPNQSVLRDAVMLRPDPAWTEPLRALVPRTVVQRWGDQPGQRAVAWIGRAVSLASSGASRGTDERTLVANLGDSPAVPQLTLFMDGRGDPFGTKKTSTASGHAKALHLTPFLAAVQREADLLQLLSVEPLGPKSRYKPGELSCFLTHLTLPAAAEIWVGDTRTTGDRTVALKETVFVRMGAGALAVRVLLATRPDGAPAEIALVTDSPASPARRLTVTHATREPRGRGSVAIWVQAADGLDDRTFAAWRGEFLRRPAHVQAEGAVVSLEVAGRHGPLRLMADIAAQQRTVLAGGEPEALLSVNGRDHGREVLREWVD